MDGSYGNTLPPGSSQMLPSQSSSSSNMYKANVNRSKTRKWVEAKVQSYDGDDWGADYDEPEEPPLPPPPPKPMGPRQASGPPLSSRPHQPVDAATASTGLRSPSSPPSLHVQTSAATTPRPSQPDVDSPWFVNSTSQRGIGGQPPTEQITSPPPANIPQSAATVSSVYSSALPPSGPSSAPQSAALSHPRFPPRKSSMSSQQDPVDYSDLIRQSGPTSPDSAQKVRVEPGPTSPASAKSPMSPNKPLPFIRPADIYRRMEEEREKERRSIESSRASLDSAGARGSGLGSPSIQQHQQPEHLQQPAEEAVSKEADAVTIPKTEVLADPRQGPKPSLPSVAERKSEYGLEGLLDSYGSEEDRIEPPPAAPPSSQIQASETIPDQAYCIQLAEAPSSPTEQELRRFSASPKLPDLARMSVFGDDLFSTSSQSFLSQTPPPLPSIPDEIQQPTAAQIKTTQTQPQETMQKQPVSPPTELVGESSPAPTPPPQISSTLAVESTSDRIMSQDPAEVAQQGSEEDPSPSSDKKTVEQHTAALPQPPENLPKPASVASSSSGIVARIGEAPQEKASDDVAHEPEQALPIKTSPGPLQIHLPPVTVAVPEAGEVSPVTETDESDEESETAATHEVAGNGKREVADVTGSEAEVAFSSPKLSTGLSNVAAPLVRTGSPASITSLQPGPAQSQLVTEGELIERKNHSDSSEDEPATPVPPTASAIAHRDITPTAPLNPRKDAPISDVSRQDSVPPPALECISTIDTSNSSPVKESDMLREEIIRSLSPVPTTPLQQSANIFDPEGGGRTATASSEGPTRESTYLGDVYGDYWSSNDDKEEDLKLDEPKDSVKPLELPSLPKQPVQLEAASAAASTDISRTLLDMTSLDETVPQVRKRFSWEAEGASHVEPKTLGTGSETATTAVPVDEPISSAEPIVSSSPDFFHLAPSTPKVDTASPIQAGAPPISHQVSKVSTIPSRAGWEAPPEPPSPVSVLSERVTGAAEVNQLTLAEEKSLMQASSAPASSSPPRDQHPSVTAQAPEAPGHALRAPTVGASLQPANILTFRQILDVPAPAERIRQFKETRQQFAAMDTGLGDWLTHLRESRPEYAGATTSFSANLSPLAGIEVPASGPSGSAVGPQGPYSQQHVNASSPGLPGAQGGRAAANMPMPPPLQGSNSFGHTSNQVGVKGKEFLMAAGKAGKGLLSKGKNKLRNTGDKVFF